MPPLPFKEPLYLSVSPRICVAFEDSVAYRRLSNAERYQLDGASLERSLKALKQAGPSILATRGAGGGDEPESD